MNELKNYSQYLSFQIVNACKNAGITHAVISPGLRCAPIIKAATLSGLKITSCIDERAAGYYALGLYKANKTRSVLICTSGTATLNYLPALAEAFKTNIPLLILTADRPVDLIKRNSNQTINQISSFTPFTKSQLALSNLQDTQIQKLQNIFNSKDFSYSPTHINLHLSEPVDDQDKAYSKENNIALKTASNFNQDKEEVDESLLGQIQKAENPLFIVGSGEYSKEDIELILNTNIPTMLDVTTGYKTTLLPSENLTPSFDHPEVRTYFRENPPDLIVKFGQYVVTKHLSNLRTTKEGKIFEEDILNNQKICFESKQRTVFNKKALLSSLKTLKREDLKHKSWQLLSKTKRENIDKFGLTFPFISKHFLDNIKTKKTIILGNSTIVRSFDYFIPKAKGPIHKIITNRGVSGIEGFTMMSKAVSEVLDEQVVVFNGDISFLHDLNSLHALKNSTGNLVYFLLNNQCGGIFNSIPILIDEKTKPFITTDHTANFEKIIKSFDINYLSVSTTEEYLELLSDIDSIKKTTIIECKIDDKKNVDLFKFLRTLNN